MVSAGEFAERGGNALIPKIVDAALAARVEPQAIAGG